ncbi:uncharacterized protein EDB91DRAFT_1256645 [Suillus paluster]|uniref:uncharacterized protein n=1 Tax=Suillus paluster TaxID=48578 RepID=UPI001B85D8AA|nr:uncharacterized protein EDB91DRAFT_1256645 [Suillus paluster]KAG1721125.1 hypothetical protein EDB91DRAFT_1256645 [Suillus paluster]
MSSQPVLAAIFISGKGGASHIIVVLERWTDCQDGMFPGDKLVFNRDVHAELKLKTGHGEHLSMNPMSQFLRTTAVITFPISTSHNLTFPSSLPPATLSLFGDNAIVVTLTAPTAVRPPTFFPTHTPRKSMVDDAKIYPTHALPFSHMQHFVVLIF